MLFAVVLVVRIVIVPLAQFVFKIYKIWKERKMFN